MPNRKSPESEYPSIEPGVSLRPRHYWVADGIERSLMPRLQEIVSVVELVESESTMELIEFVFAKYPMDLNELNGPLLLAIHESMPSIIADLRRLDYPLLKPEIFRNIQAFSERVGAEVEKRQLPGRRLVARILKG